VYVLSAVEEHASVAVMEYVPDELMVISLKFEALLQA
jgi:hypothetical protein